MARNFPRGGKGRSLSRSAISRIMEASDSSVPGGSFSDLARADKQMQVKYDRPADLKDFVNRSRTYQKGIDAGGRIEDGVLQLADANKIVRDAEGRQLLSMSAPEVRAMSPTLRQLGGDMLRALTGYNTLSYDPDAVGTASTTGGTIVRNEGIMSNINPLSFIPGVGMAKNFIEGAKSVYDFMFPKDPVVTYGGSSDITVSEEPSGVMTAFPYNFETELKTKPEIPASTPGQFTALDNPALYGDGTFFDRFDEQLEALGIEQDPLYS